MTKRRSGFTLVELVVVVLILGIIAAIAIPKVAQSTTAATDNSLRTSLSVLRDSIDLYATDHGNTLPGAAGDGTNAAGSELAFKNQMTQYSDVTGKVSVNKNASFPYGPYLRQGFPKVPVGPKVGQSSVKMENAGTPLSGEASATAAWRYDYTTGAFIADTTAVSGDGTTTYDQF